ncbi:MAG: hypothetical protein B6I20_05680 [Bacteroidetes bacterium 4572_117]|nr:MAG: hypothetical protein B6I20_05680 [Bacteroidetes bacterium 4572_117]
MTKLKLHTRLKEARKFLELNQLAVATDLNIQQKTVSEIENGKLLNIPNTYINYFYRKGISLKWIYDASGTMLENEIQSNAETNQENTAKTLFDLVQTETETEKSTEKGGGDAQLTEPLQNNSLKDLLNSKDFNIKTLLSYVKSLEKSIEFLQQIIKKEMKL